MIIHQDPLYHAAQNRVKTGLCQRTPSSNIQHSILQLNSDTKYYRLQLVTCRDLRSFVIRFDFESYVRFETRFVLMVRFEIFESSALSIVIRKETIGGG